MKIARDVRWWFVLVSAWCVSFGALRAEGQVVSVSPSPDGLAVRIGKRLVLDYRHKDDPAKPYVKRLHTPSGVNVLRDSPHDHLHHHALMFALAVDGVSFWTEKKKDGRQIHQSARIHSCDAGGGFIEKLEWRSPDGMTLVDEQRTIQVHEDAALSEFGATLLTWESRLSAAGNTDRKLSGAHYYGLGMRFLVSMDKGGKFVNSEAKEGKIFRGAERLLSAKWCAYLAKADGKPVTAVMFDDPGNVRHPATWFTMPKPFAYLAATLNLHEKPLMLKVDQPLMLRYGVAVCDGHLTAQQLETLYRLWVKKAPRSKKSGK